MREAQQIDKTQWINNCVWVQNKSIIFCLKSGKQQIFWLSVVFHWCSWWWQLWKHITMNFKVTCKYIFVEQCVCLEGANGTNLCCNQCNLHFTGNGLAIHNLLQFLYHLNLPSTGMVVSVHPLKVSFLQNIYGKGSGLGTCYLLLMLFPMHFRCYSWGSPARNVKQHWSAIFPCFLALDAHQVH